MRDLTTVLVLGGVTGLQAALLAVGLVLIYRAQRFINFAQAQSGFVAASILGVLVLGHDVPYALAAPVAVGGGLLTSLGVGRLIAWRLSDASPTTKVIGTIAISQLLLIVVASGPVSIEPADLATRGYPLPFRAHLTIGGYTLNAGEIATLVVGPLLVIGVQLFITRTRTGIAIRGMASNPEAAQLAGVSVRRTSMIVWGIAGLVSAVAAILFAPSQPAGALAASGTGLMLLGLAAALAAGLHDIRVAFLAGLAVGLVQQACLYWIDQPGFSDLAVFAFLAIALAARSGLLPARDVDAPLARPAAPTTRRGKQLGRLGWVLLGVVLVLLPLLPGLRTQEKALLLTLIISYAITGLSLTVLTGWAGQVSMGQFAFVGVGAFVSARMFEQNLSIPIVLINTALITAAATVIVGLPALRLGRLFTAISTLGFAFVAQTWLFRQSWLTGSDTGYMSVDRLHILGTEVTTTRGVYAVSLGVLGVIVVLLRTIRSSSLGRTIIAVRDNPDLAGATGTSPSVGRLLALAISGMIAGMAGTVWAMATRQWTFDSFDPTLSLVLLAAAIVGSLGVLHGPILGAFAVFAWPYLVPGSNTLVIRSLSSGALLLVVLLFLPDGFGGALQRLALRLRPDDAAVLGSTEVADLAPRRGRAARLVVTEVSKRFGGITAVHRAHLTADAGEIVGIIGGNGAGKSTLIDCISGRQILDDGRVELDGRDITFLSPHERASRGVARTFQDAALFASLTVEEAVLVAVEGTNPTGPISAGLGTPWALLAELEKREDVAAILHALGLADHAHRTTSELSTGMRRICELAAAVAARPSLILLDEPTAGLAQREVEAFAPRLRALSEAYGATVVIVEHDIPLLVDLCDRLYCMELGSIIAEGPPAQVIADPRVIASCLGTDESAITRSGRVATKRTAKKAAAPRAAALSTRGAV